MIYVSNKFMINSRAFIQENFSQARWQQVCDAMSLQTRTFFDTAINPKGTVDFDKVSDVLAAIDGLLSDEKPHILIEMGAYNSNADISGFQRLMMKLFSVKWVLKIAAKLWEQRIINGGQIIIEEAGKNHAYATVENFEMPDARWWTYLQGWFATAIRISGGDEVRVRWLEGGNSPNDSARFEVRWL